MDEEFNDILLKNVLKIFNSENEYLNKNEFDYSVFDVEEIISILVKLDLIEQESIPNIYFLSPESYELIESGEIKAYIYTQLNYDNEENINNDKNYYYEDNGNSISSNYFTRCFKLIIYISLAAILYLVFYFTKKNSKNEQKFHFENLILIDENGDTMK